jgi:8-amino-7-oxononanoate synthase
MYSAGLNPPAAAAARKALEIARESDRSDQLLDNAAYLRDRIEAAGFETWGETHIVPVIIGDPGQTTEFANRMEQQGILVHDVPYPAVEYGTDRLRLIPTATHTTDELDRAADALIDIGSELNIIESSD